jgi:hypothetical protein
MSFFEAREASQTGLVKYLVDERESFYPNIFLICSGATRQAMTDQSAILDHSTDDAIANLKTLETKDRPYRPDYTSESCAINLQISSIFFN